jgi:hypothetical protein
METDGNVMETEEIVTETKDLYNFNIMWRANIIEIERKGYNKGRTDDTRIVV